MRKINQIMCGTDLVINKPFLYFNFLKKYAGIFSVQKAFMRKKVNVAFT